jgi:hypothetical protein
MTTEYHSRVIDTLFDMHRQKAAAYEFIRWSPDRAKEALTAGIAWVLSRPRLPHGAAPANDALDALSWARATPDEITPDARRKAEAIVAERINT